MLLGRLAVERGLISETQLQDCMKEQQKALSASTDPNKTLGATSVPRPLGVVMLARGLIKEQDLVKLLDEQNQKLKAFENFQKMQKVEYLFGQLLVKHNKATQLQINKCLQIQQQRAEKGLQPVQRLGELLVEHGFVTKEDVADVLRMQHKDLLFCTGCGKQFNVVGLEEGKAYRCKSCGGVMLQRSFLETLRAEETNFGFELPTEER